MKAWKVLGRFVVASTVGIVVLLSGVFTAIVASVLALPNAPADAGRTPGDGFLTLEFLALAVIVCVPLSIAAASWVLFRKEGFLKQILHGRGGLFLGR